MTRRHRSRERLDGTEEQNQSSSDVETTLPPVDGDLVTPVQLTVESRAHGWQLDH